jgi:carbamoyl-phosphate synthase large subunit
MNVLITSASAKVLLVRAFQAAVRSRGGKVVACDVASDSAALFAADEAVLMPPTGDASFRARLLGLCAERNIALVVPTRDGELPLLAELAPTLAAHGTRVLVAPPATVTRCQDKRVFNRFCEDNGYPIARTYYSDPPPVFPVFARPAIGAGGHGAAKIDNRAAWEALEASRSELVVQDVVRAPEYTIDTLLDLDGRPLQAVARLRQAVRNGEAYKSRVEDLPELTDMALSLCARLGCIGHNVVQAFYRPETGPLLIEVNPRFGGASNLSICAGLDSPSRLVALLAGETPPDPRPIRFGLTMLRYSDDMIIEDAALRQLDSHRE